MGAVNRCCFDKHLFKNQIYAEGAPMTPRERALHKRIGRLKGELFKAIAYLESIQLMLVSHDA